MPSRLQNLATVRRMMRLAHADRAEIVAFQNDRLRRIVAHAYARVPYYRRLFDAHGLRPEAIRSVDDLHRIPISSKQEMRDLPRDELIADDADRSRLRAHSTSGSSGHPFTVWRTPGGTPFLIAPLLRMRKAYGAPWTGRAAFVNNAAHARRTRRRRRLWRDTLHIDCALPADEIRSELLAFRPEVISGFPSAMALVANVLTPEDRERIRPRMIFTASEVLTPSLREQISRAFDAPVHDTYNCWELAHIAAEDPRSGLYLVADDCVIVEVIREDGRPAEDGETGELVGTHLHFETMPFLRYRLGDLVTRGPAGGVGGSPFSTLRAIQGRTVDIFRLPGGRRLHPFAITLELVPVRWIRRYQLVQEREDRILLRVVPEVAPEEAEMETLRRIVEKSVGPGVGIDIELVKDIPPEAGGKFRLAHSKLSAEPGHPEVDGPIRPPQGPEGATAGA